MENLKGRKTSVDDDLVFEDFVPSSAWTEDSSSHYLLVDLPGFKKEELKLQVDEHGHVLVSGERQTNNNKIVYFKETFKMPEDSNTERINGKFEGEVLYVTVPKQVKEKEEKFHDSVSANMGREKCTNEVEKPNIDTNDIVKETFSHKQNGDGKNMRTEGVKDRWRSESRSLRNATEILRKNKGMVVTALLAFSLGMLVARTFHSNKDSE